VKKFIRLITIYISQVLAFIIQKFFVRFTIFFIKNITTQYIVQKVKSCGENPNILFPIKAEGLKYITIGDNFEACSRLRLEAFDMYMKVQYTPQINIGDNVNISYDCHIGCVNRVKIGNNVLIASKVFITDHSHGDSSYKSLLVAPRLRHVTSKGPVIIEDNVWIGEGASIMPNVKIGHNSIIGTNAVVTKDVPPFSIVGGAPAKVIKKVEII